MNTLRVFLLSTLLIMSTAMQSDKPAYLIFDQKGKAISYNDMLQALPDADIILFGEYHNNPICHWLQFEISRDLYSKIGNKLILAAEMFEADDQMVLNEYLSGYIKEDHFKKEAKIWNNYVTDYRPLVEFAKKQQLPFVASNIPRRYASMVAFGGLQALDRLSDEARRMMAPLPLQVDMSLPGYQKMTEMMGGAHGTTAENMVHAQAIKDATMAFRILKYWEKGKIVLHFNGSYHSDNFEGIVWYLKKQKPDLRIITISTSEQEEVSPLKPEAIGIANFVISIPSTMTKTY